MTKDEALKTLSTPSYDMAPVLVEACCIGERASEPPSRIGSGACDSDPSR